VFFVCILRFALFSTDVFTTNIVDRLGIVIHLRPGYDRESVRVQECISGIKNRWDVISVEYISQSDVLDTMKKRDPALASLVETDDQNPFPNSIRISHIRDLDIYKEVDAYVTQFQDVLQYDASSTDSRLLEYQSQYREISSIIAKLQILKWAMYIFLILFILTVVAIIFMVIHTLTFFVQDEIRIIELVGGQPLYIYGPLSLQGALYTSVASILVIGFIQSLLIAI
jgi:cell division protein FtsX